MSSGSYIGARQGVQLKIQSKRLKSGKCQVKFSTDGMRDHDCYGYTLVDASCTLREVVLRIREELRQVGDIGMFHQRGLFSVGNARKSPPEFLIYRKDPLGR